MVPGARYSHGARNAICPKIQLEMAEWTGLEPATPGVTGRYSNQLNYHSGWHLLVGAEGIEPPTFAL
jgi:hypothetical protein